MKRLSVVAAALAVCALARDAAATDYVSGRIGGMWFPLGDTQGFALAAGGAWEGNAKPDSFGFRLGGDLVLTRWTSAPSTGETVLVRPELAAYLGGDMSAVRPFLALRPGFGAALAPGDTRFAWTLEIGPELEWRRIGASGPVVRAGLFFAPASAPTGDAEWGRIALALTFGWEGATQGGVRVPDVPCVPLPTRACPPP